MSSKNDKKQNLGLFSRIRRAPYQSFAAILTLSITLFTTGVVVSLVTGSAVVISYFESKPQVTAFYKPDVTPDQSQIDNLTSRLRATGETTAIKFISKDEALGIYQNLFKDDPILLELVTAKMLPASIEVAASDPKDLASLSQMLKNEPDIDQVIFQENVVSSVIRWAEALRTIGVGFTVLLVFQSIVVISIITNLKIAAKREEIEILGLLGASQWFIYRPFLADSLFYSVVGGLVGWLGTFIVILYTTPFLISFLSGVPIFPIPTIYFLSLLIFEIILSVVIGLLASLATFKRYLRS